MTPPRNEPRSPPDVDDAEDSNMRADQHWRVSKQINVATVITLALWAVTQTAVMSYGWATMAGRVDVHGDRIVVLEHTVTALGPMSERVVKMETDIHYITEGLTEIKNLLRQVPTRAEPRAP